MQLSSLGPLGALVPLEVKSGRQEEVSLSSGGPLGALDSLDVNTGQIEDGQRGGLVQEFPWDHWSHWK